MTVPGAQTYSHTDQHLLYEGNWKGIHNATAGSIATSNDPKANVTFVSPPLNFVSGFQSPDDGTLKDIPFESYLFQIFWNENSFWGLS
jgi:hypothetical protein